MAYGEHFLLHCVGISAGVYCINHHAYWGGGIFAITFFRTRSLLLTSVEHALYGSWLFTLGIGEMLAFPMPE
jgi:hypothetical protein